MINVQKLFVTLSLVSLALGIYGQSPYFKTIPINRSGQASKVTCITQDSKGYIWLSTSKGLIRFDGIESVAFGAKDSIDPSPVTCIYEDKEHILWLGHKNGIIEYFANGYFNKFKPEEGLSSSEITFITTDLYGILWFGTLGEGVYYYKGENRKRLYNLNSDDGLNDNYVYSFAESPDGKIYLGTDNGIGIIDQDTYKVIDLVSMRNGLPDNIVKKVVIDGHLLWVGTDEKGICIYNIDTKEFIKSENWNYGSLTSFIIRNNAECWIGTKSSGLLKVELHDNKLVVQKEFTMHNGLPSDELITIFNDHENNIWGGSKDGLFLMAASAFEFIDKKTEGYDFGTTYSFIVDNHGQYWAATDQGIIKLTKDISGTFIFNKVKLADDNKPISFISLYEDNQGYIWAGTYGSGVYKINPINNDHINFTNKNGLTDNNILQISGTGDNVWMATAGGGAVLYNTKTKSFTNYNTTNGLGSDYLYAVFPDSKGNIWFALDGGGVSVLENNKMITKFLPDSLGINTVYSVVEDKSGTIWLQTADKGLIEYDENHFEYISSDDGPVLYGIRSIIADMQGNLVIVSNESVQLLLASENAVELFGSERGVAYLEPNLNGISMDDDGNTWIATGKGVVKFNSKITQLEGLEPHIEITRKLLFFEPFDDKTSKFNYKQNNLTFEYAGFWYQASENLVYRYKLENYDFDWSRPTTSRTFTYSNLPPGKYTFKVEVSHKSGIWIGSENAIYSFVIKPPFYRTGWFITLCLIIVILSVYYYIKYRTAKLIKDKEILELEVKKRTETITIQKEEIEAQRDEIEAQRDFVTQQRDKIALQNEHITSGIQYASRIQNALFQPKEEYERNFKDIFILNRPMNIVSGDFYWFKEIEKRLFIVVADCTGHGVSGAFMSILGISLIGKIVNACPYLSAAEVLNYLRDEIKIALRQTGKSGETKDGMDIAIIIADKKNKTYQMAGANNPVYLIRNKELIAFKTDRMPIGIYPIERPFTNNVGEIEPDDTFYLFSDGYYDQLGGPDDNKFQSKRFKELLLANFELPLQKQYEVLNDTMNAWKGERAQNDDILVVGFKLL